MWLTPRTKLDATPAFSLPLLSWPAALVAVAWDIVPANAHEREHRQAATAGLDYEIGRGIETPSSQRAEHRFALAVNPIPIVRRVPFYSGDRGEGGNKDHTKPEPQAIAEVRGIPREHGD